MAERERIWDEKGEEMMWGTGIEIGRNRGDKRRRKEMNGSRGSREWKEGKTSGRGMRKKPERSAEVRIWRGGRYDKGRSVLALHDWSMISSVMDLTG